MLSCYCGECGDCQVIKSSHGGPREGAGRKPAKVKKVKVLITLDDKLNKKALASGNRSGLINELLAKHFIRD